MINRYVFFVQCCKSYIGIEPIPEYKFHNSRKWRFDYAFPEQKVAVEIEGGIWTQGRHVRPYGYRADMEKYNAAAALGWKVFRFEPSKITTTKTLQLLKLVIKDECIRDFGRNKRL